MWFENNYGSYKWCGKHKQNGTAKRKKSKGCFGKGRDTTCQYKGIKSANT